MCEKTLLPEVIVFAGPNGSGKSTITRLAKTVGAYINADDIKKSNLCSDLEAAQKAEEMREKALEERKDFTFETVLSTERNLNLLKKAKESGYFVRCIYVLTANPDINVINYFMENGTSFMYSDIRDNILGYTYVSYQEFYDAETIIEMILNNMPSDLNKLEMAKYVYISVAKYMSSNINSNDAKNEVYNFSLMSTVNNLWGSLASGSITDISASKIYYYLCRRLNIDINLIIDEENKKAKTELLIAKQALLTDIYEDIPYIWCNMQTRYFATYNDDLALDKKIKYIKNKYTDYYLDKVLKDIDYTEE